MALGASLGGLAGLIFDANKSGVDVTFLDDVSKQLTAGKVAAVAEIDEGWTARSTRACTSSMVWSSGSCAAR